MQVCWVFLSVPLVVSLQNCTPWTGGALPGQERDLMRNERRLANVRLGSANALGVLIAAVTLSACEGGAPAAPSGLSLSPAVSATLSAEEHWTEIAPFAGPPLLARACGGRPYVTPALDLAIVASRTVNVDRVTLRMLDGSNLGGPMVAFPQAGLTNEFGNTVVAAGQSRHFWFYPSFPCGGVPYGYTAELTLVEPTGATYALTVSGSAR
jgi:hypothetical protein